MLKKNDPTREGEAVECLLGCDIHGHTANRLRAQLLQQRFGLHPVRAELVSTLAWGALA